MFLSHICILSIFSLAASAIDPLHVSPTIKYGPSGGSFITEFRVSHGCGDNDTVELVMTIPEGVLRAQPRQMDGYEISTTTRSVDPPEELHGRPVTETVDTITWKGHLPRDQYQLYGVRMYLPDVMKETPLRFETMQYCENGT